MARRPSGRRWSRSVRCRRCLPPRAPHALGAQARMHAQRRTTPASERAQKGTRRGPARQHAETDTRMESAETESARAREREGQYAEGHIGQAPRA